ncbi:MAG: iron-containing alcohol dehydrogenase, partial [Bacteroidales bacterium]
MENFIAHNPTSLHFGKGVIETIGKTVEPLGKKVLLVYGKGSVKKSGLYDRIIVQL